MPSNSQVVPCEQTTDTHDKPNSRFLQLCKKPKKHGTWYSQEAAQRQCHYPQLPWYISTIKKLIMVLKKFNVLNGRVFQTLKNIFKVGKLFTPEIYMWKNLTPTYRKFNRISRILYFIWENSVSGNFLSRNTV